MAHPVDWDRFESEGFLPLGKVASDAQIEALRNRIDEIMLGKIRYEGMYFQLDSDTGQYADVPVGGAYEGPTLNYRKIEQLEKDPLFRAYITAPLFREIAARVYPADVSVYRAMFMNKPAGTGGGAGARTGGTVLPYHQDGGTGWNLSAHPLITIWTALDPAARANGCMQVIPGSHKLGLLTERGHTLSAEHEALYAPDEKSVYLEAETGEAILLHNWLIHRSGINTINCARRALSVCYTDAATRYLANNHTYPVVFSATGREAA
ncbi:MAG TPA: phytanoyl-CoA dioxygenase family protein [Chthonomonadales bacterium]|nr:phytanoyl-CoA dioxygenase family protein [Chthonomonadales bacterium]